VWSLRSQVVRSRTKHSDIPHAYWTCRIPASSGSGAATWGQAPPGGVRPRLSGRGSPAPLRRRRARA
jgi:hypothetical protein